MQSNSFQSISVNINEPIVFTAALFTFFILSNCQYDQTNQFTIKKWSYLKLLVVKLFYCVTKFLIFVFALLKWQNALHMSLKSKLSATSIHNLWKSHHLIVLSRPTPSDWNLTVLGILGNIVLPRLINPFNLKILAAHRNMVTKSYLTRASWSL
jgi:hypothetical protein